MSSYTMRTACRCGSTTGEIRPTNGQNCVYCTGCGRHAYNAPKHETGEAPRSVASRPDMKPSQRARILERDAGRCLICGRPAGKVMLNIGHILSVDDGKKLGATDEEINDDANLIAQCEECNLGQGAKSLEPRHAMLLVRAAVMRAQRAQKQLELRPTRAVLERNYDTPRDEKDAAE